MNACNGGCTVSGLFGALSNPDNDCYSYQVDYMCVHWYDVKASDFQTYVEKWHSIYNKDIFITEFAPQVRRV